MTRSSGMSSKPWHCAHSYNGVCVELDLRRYTVFMQVHGSMANGKSGTPDVAVQQGSWHTLSERTHSKAHLLFMFVLLFTSQGRLGPLSSGSYLAVPSVVRRKSWSVQMEMPFAQGERGAADRS